MHKDNPQTGGADQDYQYFRLVGGHNNKEIIIMLCENILKFIFHQADKAAQFWRTATPRFQVEWYSMEAHDQSENLKGITKNKEKKDRKILCV